MGRPGITYDQVNAACWQLLADGQPFTVDRVTQVVGSGSRTTINGFVKKFREELATIAANRLGATDVPSEFTAAFNSFWDTASRLAKEQLDDAWEELKVTQSEIEEEIKTLRETASNEETRRLRLQAELAEVKEELATVQDRREATTIELTRSQADVDNLRVQLAACNRERAEGDVRTKKAIKDMETRLVAAEKALGEQRRDLQKEAEQTRNLLIEEARRDRAVRETEIRSLNKKLSTRDNQITKQTREIESLKAKLAAARKQHKPAARARAKPAPKATKHKAPSKKASKPN